MAKYIESNGDEFTFSPVFPREVIETAWLDAETILDLKMGLRTMLESTE